MTTRKLIDLEAFRRHQAFPSEDRHLAQELMNYLVFAAWEHESYLNQNLSMMDGLGVIFEDEKLVEREFYKTIEVIATKVKEFDRDFELFSNRQIENYNHYQETLSFYCRPIQEIHLEHEKSLGKANYEIMLRHNLADILDGVNFSKIGEFNEELSYRSFEWYVSVTPEYIFEIAGEFILLHWAFIVKDSFYIKQAYSKYNGKCQPKDKSKYIYPDDWTTRFIEILGLLLYRMNIMPSQSYEDVKHLRKRISYKWQGDEDDLKELYNMVNDKYIIDASFEQFNAIFNQSALDNINPLKWHDDNASEVLYFIKRLQETGNVDGGKIMNYQRITACFVKPNGEKFTARFKSLNQNILINLSDQKRDSIDNLVKEY